MFLLKGFANAVQLTINRQNLAYDLKHGFIDQYTYNRAVGSMNCDSYMEQHFTAGERQTALDMAAMWMQAGRQPCLYQYLQGGKIKVVFRWNSKRRTAKATPQRKAA